MTNHRPLPWKIEIEDDSDRSYLVLDKTCDYMDDSVFDDVTYYPTAPDLDTAKFIVKSVNCHYQLLEALKGMIAYSIMPECVQDTEGCLYVSGAKLAIKLAKGE